MHRRAVLQIASLAALPLLPRLARADEDGVCEPPEVACERVVTRVGTNHGHVLEVSPADVKACLDRTYDLRGTAGHAHTVTVSAADFRRLAAGETLRMPSTRDGGHLHRLLVRCAPAVDPPERVNVCQVEIGGKDDHELIIPAAHIAAASDRAYDIQGVAPHTHAVSMKASDFRRLARGEQLALTTTAGGGHTHVVFVRYPLRPAGA